MFEFNQADFERYCENLNDLIENYFYKDLKENKLSEILLENYR